MKKIIIIPTTLLLNACSHAPEPAQAKGGWYELNTTIEQVRADTYHNGMVLQQPVSQPNSTVQYSNHAVSARRMGRERIQRDGPSAARVTAKQHCSIQQ
ncbi:hypothetical protein AAGN56_28305 [Klebsiella pneumoniae]